MSCIFFFVGIFFTGIGSAFYHLNPDNSTLIGDRLPMTISFMSLFSLLTGTIIDQSFGKRILYPLLGFGILSVWLWTIYDDLRLYALVQFLPIILMPLILLLYNNNSSLKKCFWLMMLFYGIAKTFEALDFETYHTFGSISGHSIKHLFAALVPLILLIELRKNIKGSPSEQFSS